MVYIELQNLSKQYPHKKDWALKNFQLSIAKGEFIAIVGPSGSGKSTLLNLLTGFEKTTEGAFILAEENITDYAPKDRNIAMVFQEYALFPHMTVKDNIAFGMKVRKEGKQQIEEKIHWAAESLELDKLLSEKPKNLSGGQRQRVALARAIVREPKVFLLDEPLSNLDAKLREQTGALIRQVHDRLKATTIFVTHSQDEAMSLADRVVVLKDGVIQQIGTPREIYETPANLFTASFIGRPEINQFEGTLLMDGSFSIGSEQQAVDLPKGQPVILAVRSEDIHLSERPENFQGTIQKVRYIGNEQLVSVVWQDQTVAIRVPATVKLAVDEEIYFTIDQSKILAFDKQHHTKINKEIMEEKR